MNKKTANIDPSSIKVSGPINVLRLEGNIHGIKKVIYLFMDNHTDVKYQTQCSNVFSQDVQKYFADSFYNLNDSNIVHDFFLEVYPTELSNRKNLINADVERKDIYIEEVVKFFKKIFVYDPKKNRVHISNLFHNVRLHFIDIRDYYKTTMTSQLSEMKYIARNFMSNDSINVAGLEKIIDLLQFMRAHLDLIVKILSEGTLNTNKTTKIISPKSDVANIEALIYLTKKLKEKYKYKDVKQAMNQLIRQSIDNFTNTINDTDAAIQQFNQYADILIDTRGNFVRDENTLYMYSYGASIYTVRKMIVDINNRVDMLLDEEFIEYFARFTDIFFLRRFLDKDYITNAIVYTGGLHSNTYVHELVTKFDFRVTHASYSKISDLKKLTKEIKKRSLLEIQELIFPQTLNQCSDMTNFPANFA